MKQVKLEDLFSIMDYLRETDYPKSKHVARFIEDIKEHFEEQREGQSKSHKIYIDGAGDYKN